VAEEGINQLSRPFLKSDWLRPLWKGDAGTSTASAWLEDQAPEKEGKAVQIECILELGQKVRLKQEAWIRFPSASRV